ncbi:SpoIIE family protein phosphatase [Streptantibioticus ferralitis]|uniref:SpoIIE family protein phosphatase n=1 Tax=Streptantibioticus ferralitis TaxID=236510 RepID=A0ABT5YYW8_9ACTN|nr:SpoIIE family protein phosphatase [Streptantibioticus ferralitis]MDF2256607.1 SpoIIE family protein phosphatase [Streptantibioticus ferralitis]
MPSDRPDDEGHGPFWSEPGTLLQHVAVAMFGVDEDDRICYWGPGAGHLFGYPSAEVLSKPAAILFPGSPAEGFPGTALDGPDGYARMTAESRARGYWRGRLPIRHRDGAVFDCGFRVFPVTGAGGRSVVMALASRGDELDRVKTNLAFLDALFATCPIGLVMLDEDLRYVHLNQALADMDGLPIAEHLGRRFTEIAITSDGGEYERRLRAVATEGRPIVGMLVGMRTRGHPDRDQVRSVSFFPLSQASGTRPGLGGLLVDVTDREQAIVEASATRQRLALLDRASARIGTTLDVRVTAQELVEAAVPDFSDCAVVELVQWMDEGRPFDPGLPVTTLRIASGTARSPRGTEPVGRAEHVRYPPGSAVHQVLGTGRPVCAPANEEFLARTVLDQGCARVLAESDLGWLLLAPLIARGSAQGFAVFGRSATRPMFSEEDLNLAGELASRAALCLDNARLYSRERDIALTLQRALLPRSPATSPYLDVVHRYRPGSRVTEVGGDWYDVINLPGDRVALVVGDVMGHGVPAAASMGKLRVTLRVLSRRDPEPEDLLTELDQIAQEAGVDLATCLYAVYDPATGHTRIASAGHPPPLVLHPEGHVETIGDVLGVPLGVGGCRFRSTDIKLPRGATLALYTDGLIEAPGRDIEDGLAALRAELGRTPEPLDATADRVLTRLLPTPPTDDTVLVLARVREPRPGPPPEAPGPVGDQPTERL